MIVTYSCTFIGNELSLKVIESKKDKDRERKQEIEKGTEKIEIHQEEGDSVREKESKRV
jgi:hypothetical protein